MKQGQRKMSAACDSATLQVAQVIPATEAEGPGRRFAIWLQGCPLRCPGCCNPEMLPFVGGTAVAVSELAAQILAAKREHAIEGISLLGGEPFAQAAGAADLATIVRDAGLGVMIYSGFTAAQLRERHDADTDRLLAGTDLLVDGPYIREQPETRRRWIGSTNQQVHFLTERYDQDDPEWLLPNTLEIRLVGDELTVNGFPAAGLKDFWRKLPQRGVASG
jgi:anaerobic ribonucleoside-triphosphate reductase activating protein